MSSVAFEPLASADAIVGERVHLLLRRNRLSQGALAGVLNLDQSSLSKKLRGERGWTLDELLAAARYFQVSVADLLPGDDYAPVLEGRGRGVVRHQGLEPRTR